ncbi:MAG: hypothetical protein WDA16_01475 [Candidatus Thermoplasmatota archaeon]
MDEPHFRAAYDADAANRSRQSWEEYKGWVQKFYDGQRFPPIPGWAKKQDELSRAHATRPEVRAQLDSTGKLLASEWAKDNGVRKVSTSDLQSWSKRFEGASKDADALLAALRDVEQQVIGRLGPTSA